MPLPLGAADQQQGTGADGQGLLLSASGVSAVVTAAWLSSLGTHRHRGLFVIGGAAMDAFGPTGLLMTLSAAQAVMVLFAVFRLMVNKGIEPEQKTPYAPVPMSAVEGDLQLPETS